MHLTIIVATLVMIAGLVLYFLAGGKPSETGRLMFLVGLFWVLARVGEATVQVIGPR